MTFRILLVEDDPVWRTELEIFLNRQPDMKIAYIAQSKDEAVAYWSSNKVDVILMDLNLSMTEKNLDGIYAAAEIYDRDENVKIIALTSIDEHEIIRNAHRAGAILYINKSTGFRKLPELIRFCLDPEQSSLGILRQDYIETKRTVLLNKLTSSQQKIVELKMQGHNNNQVQQLLCITESTLKNQITSILKKFNLKSMKEVIIHIKTRGL